MDHAGGASTLLAAMPEAQVYLHSLTIPHLIDPTKLLGSAARALGELFPLHGPLPPMPADRIQPAENLTLDLGRGVVIEAIPTPGHSPDHVSFFERATGCLWTGDAVGIVVPAYDYRGPVTPPPAVDVIAQQQTFDRLLNMQIGQLLFSHYGPASAAPHTIIEQLRARYEQLDQLVQAGLAAGAVDEQRIIQAMLDAEHTPDHAAFVLAGWIKMSILGLVRWHTKRAASKE